MAAILSSRRRNVARLEDMKSPPSVLVQAVIVPGEATNEGQLIEAVSLPWFEIIETMLKDPDTIYQLHWRQWEEIVAGAYKKQGFEVTLTPRSNDGGRDVIADSHGIGRIRYIDQVKAYKPGHLVTADDVRTMLGVLEADKNVSKGIITTTSEFAPGIEKDEKLSAFMPYRLELKPRSALLEWLADVSGRKGQPDDS